MHFTWVIPAYNEEDYIIDTLSSIYPQNISDATYNIIVVNNASTDKTKDVIQKFIQKNQSENIFILDEFVKGIIPARRAGIEKAIEIFGVENHWIVNADADSIYLKNWLSNIAKIINTNAKIDFIQGIAGGEDLSNYPNILNLIQPFKSKARELIENNKFSPVSDSVCAFSAKFYLDCGGYNREYVDGNEQMAETWRLYIKGKLLGFKREFCNENISIQNNRRLREQFLELEIGGDVIDGLYKTDIRNSKTNVMDIIEKEPTKYITPEMLDKIFLEKIRILCFMGILTENKPSFQGKMAVFNSDLADFINTERTNSFIFLGQGGSVGMQQH